MNQHYYGIKPHLEHFVEGKTHTNCLSACLSMCEPL